MCGVVLLSTVRVQAAADRRRQRGNGEMHVRRPHPARVPDLYWPLLAGGSDRPLLPRVFGIIRDADDDE